MRYIEPDREALRKLIEDDDLTHIQVGKLLGCSRDTIGRRCKEWGIQTARTGPKAGPRHTGWKGGERIVKGYRYVWMPDHPNATKQGYVAEHRLVMEQTLGRYLLPTEVVHHLNGERLDNRPGNLHVFGCNADHLRHELTGKRPNWTDAGLRKLQESSWQKGKPKRKSTAARKA